jgi:hypothetical protein
MTKYWMIADNTDPDDENEPAQIMLAHVTDVEGEFVANGRTFK